MQNKERIELRIDSQLLERVDEWRSNEPDVPARSEAIRRLLNRGLDELTSVATFELARFQVKAAALTPGVCDRIADAYLYAWENDVYPVFHENSFSKPFSDFFSVSSTQITDLLIFLDKHWLNAKMYTFYELEDHFGIKYGNSDWDRHGLIVALRYMYLSGNFNSEFWSNLLTPMKHPSEASSICRKFNREDDVYFN